MGRGWGQTGACYRFGDFELNCAAFTLTGSGRRRAIRPKVLDVLRYLVEHRPRLISKHELLDSLWSEQCVEEAAIAWAISHCRRVLCQPPATKTPIETVYGRGYRFTAEVELVALAPPDDSAGAVDPYARLSRVAQLAGQAAAKSSAYLDAVRFYGWALEAQAHDRAASPCARAELLVSLARATFQAGAEARRTLTAEQLTTVLGRRDLHGQGFHEVLTHALGTLGGSHADTEIRRALQLALAQPPLRMTQGEQSPPGPDWG